MKMYRPHRLCPRNSKPKEPSLYRSLCVSILCMFLSTVMLVGTTFAWFYSSATSAVSTITAGGLNVSTSYITKNTALAHRTESTGNSETTGPVYTYDDISTLGWVNFDGNGGNPFGSIPFTESGTSQIVFLKVENNSNSHAIYRLSLNLLGDASSAQPESNLYYGYQVLGLSVSTDSLCNFTIPDAVSDSDSHIDVTDNDKTEQVTNEGLFYGDALSAHGFSTDKNTYGGNLCVVDLPVGSTKYIAVALYMSGNSSESTDSSSFLVQLSMTVNQFGATDPLMPNKVEQSTSAALSAKPFTMSGVELEEETGKEEDTSEEVIPAEETPAETPTPTETPTGSTTETPTGSTTETPPSSTGETGTPSGASDAGTTSGTSGTSGTSDTDTSGGNGDAGSEPEPAPAPST